MGRETDQRITMVAGPGSIGITVVLGETLVTVTSRRSPHYAHLDDEQLRSVALRSARRALEVAAEEIGASQS